MSRLDQLIPLSAGLVVGFALGLAYFGGLWWTSRRIVSASGNPMLPALSLFGRLALLALGLGLMARLQPLMLLSSLPGLVAARVFLIRVITGAGSSAFPPPLPTVGFGKREE